MKITASKVVLYPHKGRQNFISTFPTFLQHDWMRLCSAAGHEQGQFLCKTCARMEFPKHSPCDAFFGQNPLSLGHNACSSFSESSPRADTKKQAIARSRKVPE
jgi:hypothetical protein